MSRPLHIRGAQVWDGENSVLRDVFVKNGRIVAGKPNHALEVDLAGYTLFPGRMNAHDHLELNHYPRTKFREVYDNAHQWGEDVNARLDDEPFKTLRRYPIWDRVFIGGLKNLLCGATTVAHHGPKYREMYRRDFPVRVLKDYGWAHSLHFNTEDEIVRSYRNTPKNHPWFIHLAEGTDEVAAVEYQRLKALGCVGANTVIVHGVGMTADDIADAAKIVRGLVWCPTTNAYLLGKTATIDQWGSKVVLGSDSRLTAEGDFSQEVQFGLQNSNTSVDQMLNMTTMTAAQWMGMSDAGHLNVSARADCVVNHSLDRGNPLLILRDGLPQIGDPALMAKFPHIQTVACTLDGAEKRMNVDLARQVQRCQLNEPGLEVDALPNNRRFIVF